MRQRPHHTINLSDDEAYKAFHQRLSGFHCSDAGIQAAWKMLKDNDYGEFNVTTLAYWDHSFAEAVHNMSYQINGQIPPPRPAVPLNPGDVIVKWEHRRLSPGKVSVWFRHRPAEAPAE